MFASALALDMLAANFFVILRRLATGAPVSSEIAWVLGGSVICLGVAVLDRILVVETRSSLWVAWDWLEVELT